MKKMITAATAALLLATALLWLPRRSTPITAEKDYAALLTPGSAPSGGLAFTDSEIAFWKQRLQRNGGDDMVCEIKLARLYSSRYHYSGNIEELNSSDSLYKKVNRLLGKTASGMYRGLAANCVTRHRFREAQQYLDSALALGDDRILSLQQQFDVAMELGDEALAKGLLHQTGSKNDFAYLVRRAKYSDHAEGDLDAGIASMEQALEKAIQSANTALICWTKANLGDMYSHAGRLKEAYTCYLDVLKKDPQYYHALKGIAWIAFSHDKNTAAAKKILHWLQQQHPVPDYDLLLAETAAYEKDTAAEEKYLRRYVTEVTKPACGAMYSKYLFYLYSDRFSDLQAAMHTAQAEVNSRPTAESYNLLSWAYYKSGNTAMALQLAKQRVENKCFEPDALYHLGVIYSAAGEKNIARRYLRQAAESSFELGPATAEAIRRELKKI